MEFLEKNRFLHRSSQKIFLREIGVNFRKADLRGAKRVGTDLKSLDLKGTRIDLSQAVQLAKSHGAMIE